MRFGLKLVFKLLIRIKIVYIFSRFLNITSKMFGEHCFRYCSNVYYDSRTVKLHKRTFHNRCNSTNLFRRLRTNHSKNVLENDSEGWWAGGRRGCLDELSERFGRTEYSGTYILSASDGMFLWFSVENNCGRRQVNACVSCDPRGTRPSVVSK